MSPTNAAGTNQRIGAELRRLRESAGYSTEDAAAALARSAGKAVQPYTVDRMENGRRPITVDEVLTLTSLYGRATAREVLFGEDDDVAALSIELHRQERDLEDLDERISRLIRERLSLSLKMYEAADAIRTGDEATPRSELSHKLADSDRPKRSLAADDVQPLLDSIISEWMRLHGSSEA